MKSVFPVKYYYLSVVFVSMRAFAAPLPTRAPCVRRRSAVSTLAAVTSAGQQPFLLVRPLSAAGKQLFALAGSPTNAAFDITLRTHCTLISAATETAALRAGAAKEGSRGDCLTGSPSLALVACLEGQRRRAARDVIYAAAARELLCSGARFAVVNEAKSSEKHLSLQTATSNTFTAPLDVLPFPLWDLCARHLASNYLKTKGSHPSKTEIALQPRSAFLSAGIFGYHASAFFSRWRLEVVARGADEKLVGNTRLFFEFVSRCNPQGGASATVCSLLERHIDALLGQLSTNGDAIEPSAHESDEPFDGCAPRRSISSDAKRVMSVHDAALLLGEAMAVGAAVRHAEEGALRYGFDV